MPKAKKHTVAIASKAPDINKCDDVIYDEDGPDSPHSSNNDDQDDSGSAKGGKKRAACYMDGDGGDMNFAGEMQKMLECFGSDISKTLSAKRKRLEQYTHSSIKNSNKKVDEIWKGQQTERQKLGDEFNKQLKGVFQQWDADLNKAKEQEDKLQHLFQQQQKLFQQTRLVQSQRLKTIKQLHDQYSKGMEDLEKYHSEQQGSVQSELKKEMALLQKKILMDTQHQEMANVRKSLQTMLF